MMAENFMMLMFDGFVRSRSFRLNDRQGRILLADDELLAGFQHKNNEK
jgi:hypothetical protein